MKYEFVRMAKLLNEAASIENYMMLLKCFQDLDVEGDISINIAKPIFEATSVEWVERSEDKDFSLAVREWIGIGNEGANT